MGNVDLNQNRHSREGMKLGENNEHKTVRPEPVEGGGRQADHQLTTSSLEANG
jgi:hypothetical protein